ncbi:MAG: tripartite tricarboxylate transporter substrate binding protein [Betaproteobacteria bacterium]|nr:tripartite tricarboxylate transporter substrate binding protein [Betaproteobacteria bacterium]
MISSCVYAALSVSLAGVGIPAFAQSADQWPAKPIRIVHGFASGGPVDAMARLMSARITDRFGQQAIVEGKPGAGGTVGAAFVAKSEADGYTLFLMASGHAASPGFYPSLGYDPVGDFAMVSMIARTAFVILAGPAATMNSIHELMAAAKAAPGKINYGSGGVGSGMHLVAELIQVRGGISLTHIPYKGGNATPLALMSGEVPIIFSSMAGVGGLVASGKARALVVTSRERIAALPNVPTVSETLFPDFDVSAWYAVAAPKNLHPVILGRLNELVRESLKRPDTQKLLASQAADAWPSSPREAQDFLAADVARWTKLIREQKISAPN